MPEITEDDIVKQCARAAELICAEVRKAVKGKDTVIELLLLSILSRGHVLLEDIPGVGKTTLALAFSKALQLAYNRVQFTPDVMPSDVTGYSIFRKSSEDFEFVRGAVMCNLFLADEINRTSSKTQSALLEVMEEGAVTVDLKRREVPKPFTVIATQNPVGSAGTQLLPESQLDRFLVRLSMGYPDRESELAILRTKSSGNPLDSVEPVISAADLSRMQTAADRIFMEDSIYGYIVGLAERTRQHDLVELGVSPRGSIALMRMAKAKALIAGRDYVLPTDVQAVYEPVFGHRLLLKSKARMTGKSTQAVLKEIMGEVPAPRIG